MFSDFMLNDNRNSNNHDYEVKTYTIANIFQDYNFDYYIYLFT